MTEHWVKENAHNFPGIELVLLPTDPKCLYNSPLNIEGIREKLLNAFLAKT